MTPIGVIIPKIMWEVVDPPFKWERHNLTVIGDHYLSDGTRLHLVKEDGYFGQDIDNALVYSSNLYNGEPNESK